MPGVGRAGTDVISCSDPWRARMRGTSLGKTPLLTSANEIVRPASGLTGHVIQYFGCFQPNAARVTCLQV